MTVTQLRGAPCCGITGKKCERRGLKKWGKSFALKDAIKVAHGHYFVAKNKRDLCFNDVKCCASISDQKTSDYGLNFSNMEESLGSSKEIL